MSDSHKPFLDAFDFAPEAMAILTADGQITAVNRRFAERTGCRQRDCPRDASQVIGAQIGRDDIWQALGASGYWSGVLQELPLGVRAGIAKLVIAAIPPTGSGERLFTAVLRDIDDRPADRPRAAAPAGHDGLTGLPDRLLLLDRLQMTAAEIRRGSGIAALMLVDLDDTTAINDRFGHQCGDKLLCRAAHRVRGCLRETDTVARLQGDTFAVILPHLAEAENAAAVAANILNRLAVAFDLDETTLQLSASIGISLLPQDGMAPHELISAADMALQTAKAAGGNTYRFARAPAPSPFPHLKERGVVFENGPMRC